MVKFTRLLTIGLLVSVSVFAADKRKQLEEELRAIPAPELPAKAVALIKAAPAQERGQVASEVVRAIVARHPGSAPTIVSAVTRAVPAVSSEAAKAAVAAAPGSAQSVAAAVGQNSVVVRPGNASVAPAGPGSAPTIANRPSAVGNAALSPQVGTRSSETALSERNSADHAPSQGKAEIKPGPIKYHKPLPEPPRRPVDPPVQKGLEPRKN